MLFRSRRRGHPLDREYDGLIPLHKGIFLLHHCLQLRSFLCLRKDSSPKCCAVLELNNHRDDVAGTPLALELEDLLA